MSDERSETPPGAPGGSDAAAEVTPGEDYRTDEEAVPEESVTDVPIGTPTSSENWLDLKRRAGDPDDITSDQSTDPSE
jgi:hypothetical protein